MHHSSSSSLNQALIGALALAASSSHAVLFIDAGTHTLNPNSGSTQFIELFISNSGSAVRVGALDLFLQLADGSEATPAIVSGDLLTGTIFSANNSGTQSDTSIPQSAFFGVSKAGGAIGSGPLIPAGLSRIATIGIDTLGATSGSWEIRMETTLLGDSGYFEDSSLADRVPIQFVNGTLNLGTVPEPSSWAVVAGLGLLGFGIWRRRHTA